MSDEMNDRLEAHGATNVSPPDADFVDRLESALRVQHVEQGSPARRKIVGLLPRLGIAVALVVAGVAGIAALTAGDAGVPISVIDDEPLAPAGQPSLPDQAPATVLAAPTQTPTPAGEQPADTSPTPAREPTAAVVATPNSPAPTATSAPLVAPSATPLVVAPAPEPTATVPEQTTPSPPPTPASATATPTPIPPATATPGPAPATAVPVPTASPVPTATPTPAEPTAIELSCEVRESGDAVGVVCEWGTVEVDGLTHYEVVRSRNGNAREVVSRQRSAAAPVFVDRDVEPGDQLIYVVRGLGEGDTLLAVSVRQAVTVPT